MTSGLGEVKRTGLALIECAPACCKISFKWYLFTFDNLKAILGSTISPIFFAVSTFLKPEKRTCRLSNSFNWRARSHLKAQDEEISFPMFLFESFEFKTSLYNPPERPDLEEGGRPVEYDSECDLRDLTLRQLKQISYVKDHVKPLNRNQKYDWPKDTTAKYQLKPISPDEETCRRRRLLCHRKMTTPQRSKTQKESIIIRR